MESNTTSGNNNYNICIGDIYNTIEEAKDCIIKYHIYNKRRFWAKTTDRIKLYYNCKLPNCRFEIGVRYQKTTDDFKVTKYIPHACNMNTSKVPGKWIKYNYGALISNVTSVKASELVKYVKNNDGAVISNQTARRVIKSVKVGFEFEEDKSYGYIDSFINWNIKNNPGSVGLYEKEGDDFNFAFMSFNCASIFFEYSDKIIYIDGTHTKSGYSGIVLTACAFDGQNHIYLLGYAIAPLENKKHWGLFLQLLDKSLGLSQLENRLIIMSDRHKSIILAVNEILPNSHHCFCVEHICRNLQ